jgi:hypothetical protein
MFACKNGFGYQKDSYSNHCEQDMKYARQQEDNGYSQDRYEKQQEPYGYQPEYPQESKDTPARARIMKAIKSRNILRK